jgi:hypothetical protein
MGRPAHEKAVRGAGYGQAMCRPALEAAALALPRLCGADPRPRRLTTFRAGTSTRVHLHSSTGRLTRLVRVPMRVCAAAAVLLLA